MIYSSFLAAILAMLSTALPLDTPIDAAEESKYTEYGSYGSYGTYDGYEISDKTVSPPPETPAVPGNFVAISTRSGDPDVHLRAVSASNQRFFIGKDTSTYCPLSDCSTYVNFTVFSARPNDANSNLGLFTATPGGQAAFVTEDGQLGYTQAHSGLQPTGSVNLPFQYTPETVPNTIGTFKFNSGGWTACPVDDSPGTYQIYALAAQGFSRTNCTGIGIATVSYDGSPAYQYN
ncbi:putative secreted protein [Golovinomyces cichoracearum]|uniref:Putative secreted protein n=1 Tax=Golovinomyces cichoracearum TaxID=62708 RepID=A0A420ISA2_9PEZI|nr:putative secreted protein [Golovinomyces cichoracearum]